MIELFVFSDVFETNRDILLEGNSVMITLFKNYVDEGKVQKKIKFHLLYDKSGSLQKKIKIEQIRKEIS